MCLPGESSFTHPLPPNVEGGGGKTGADLLINRGDYPSCFFCFSAALIFSGVIGKSLIRTPMAS